jgi:2-oxoglutarate dehydrogenase E2 component (dihydrolipoamide succinyltransferase)
LVNTARPSTADSDQQAAFLQLQGQAKRLLDEQRAEMNLEDFLPVQFTPQFWFNPADTANWTAYSTSSTSGGPTPAPPGVPPVKMAPWTWRIMTPVVQTQWSQLHSVALARAPTPAAPVKHVVMPATRMAAPSTAVLMPATRMAAATATAAPATAVRDWRIRTAYSSVAVNVATQLPKATPSSDGFSTSFEYCVVTIARPWVSSAFLSQSGWHVPGAAAASWALGKYDVAKQRFGYLPAKMVVVRNLKITARWSQEDLSRIEARAAALGPFLLLAHQFNSGTLSVPGMQILAWLCQVMPVLPPASDPAGPAG